MPSMPVHNLEAGVLLSLKAYKREKGMSEEAAETWANDHLAEGVARVRRVQRLPANARDFETAARAAFADLKAWAQSQA